MVAENLKLRMRRELVEAHKESCPWRIMAERKGSSRFVPTLPFVLIPALTDDSELTPSPSLTSRSSAANSSSPSVPATLPTTAHLLSLAATLAPRIPPELRISYPEIVSSLTSFSSSFETRLTSFLTSSPQLQSPSTLSILSSSSTTLPSLLLVIFNWTLCLPQPSPTTSSKPIPSTSSSINLPSTTVVHCSACLRRVGLWTYSTSPLPPSPTEGEPKTFDLGKEHLPSCAFREGGEGARWKMVLDALAKGLDGGEKEEEEVRKRREVVMKVSLSFSF